MTAAAGVAEVREVVRQARVLVFDFDGTLVDSNAIKWRAFAALFADFVDRRDAILTYCLGNNHTSRDEKFRHVYEDILGLPYTPDIAADLRDRFDRATTMPIISAPEIAGATAFLKAATRRWVTGVLSSTPHATLVRILAGRGWRNHFGVVRGAPVGKAEWLRGFRDEQGIRAGDRVGLVFFGDTAEDLEASQEAGCTFVGVANESLVAHGVHFIRDFSGLA